MAEFFFPPMPEHRATYLGRSTDELPNGESTCDTLSRLACIQLHFAYNATGALNALPRRQSTMLTLRNEFEPSLLKFKMMAEQFKEPQAV